MIQQYELKVFSGRYGLKTLNHSLTELKQDNHIAAYCGRGYGVPLVPRICISEDLKKVLLAFQLLHFVGSDGAAMNNLESLKRISA